VTGGVLVTGGSGYLGSLAVDALVGAGAGPVVSVDVDGPAKRRDEVVEVLGDIRHLDLAGLIDRHDVTAVVHLAAIITPPVGMSRAELRDIEVSGTTRVVDACLDAGVEHLTVASSGAAYGYTPVNRLRPRVESDPVPGHPRMAYARHKAEVEAFLARTRSQHPGLGQLVLRPGTVLGDGTDNRLAALFTRRVILGPTGTGVPFVFVWDRDVAAVIARGVTERVTGVYNLAGDGVLTLEDIAAIEARPYLRVPPLLMAAVLGVLSRARLSPYDPEEVDFLRYRPVLDNTAVKRAFPGLPRLTTAEVYARFRRARGG